MNTCMFFLRIFFLSFLVGSHFMALSQQMPAHSAKVYVDDKNDIYWNKKLPFYIHLSTSPDVEAETYQLESKVTPEYTDPSYFDTEGVNYIRSRWAVDPKTGNTISPQQELLWQVYADGIAPESSIMVNGKLFKKDNKVFIGKNATITFTAKDEVSGVENIYYALNTDAYKAYDEPVNFTDEVAHTIKYYAVDRVGNVEAKDEITYSADLSAPSTTHNLHGQYNEAVFSADVSINLEAADHLSGVKHIFYTIDNGKEKIYSDRVYIGWLPEGEHTLTYYAEDEVENRETAHTLTFFLDKTPPLLTREILGDSYLSDGKEYSSGRSRLKLTAIDNKAGIKEIYYSINGGEYILYDKPVTLNTKETKLLIEAYATDQVGNRTSTDKNQERILSLTYSDLTGPTLNYDFIGKTFPMQDTVYISGLTKIKLGGKDAESGLNKISYSIDGLPESEYQQPFYIEQPGVHEVSFFGYDNVNNRNMKRFVCYVDNEGPEVFVRFSLPKKRERILESKTIDAYSSQTVLFLSATDQKAGYEEMFYSINEDARQPYNGVIKNLKKGTENLVKVQAVDKLGNTSESLVEFFLDN